MTIHKSRTLNQAIAFLNEILKVDHDAVRTLFLLKVPCNKRMADHPSVQVLIEGGDVPPMVGPLGILNGLFGADEQGWGGIAMVIEKKRIVRFERCKRAKLIKTKTKAKK